MTCWISANRHRVLQPAMAVFLMVGFILVDRNSTGAAEQRIPPESTVTNIVLTHDEPARTVVFEEVHKINVGNFPTARTRHMITLFRLAAANLCAAGDNTKELRWLSKAFPDQALVYAKEGLLIFNSRDITPSALLKAAEEISARTQKGLDAFWELDSRKPYRFTVDAPPGQQVTRTFTGYTRSDLTTLMDKQVEAANAFMKAADDLRKGARQ